MNVIEQLGQGHISRGIILAFESGVLDIPFSPNSHNRGEVMTFRAINGAIRFANCGNMPFSEKLKDFHHRELSTRLVYERETNVVKIVERDITRIWKNDYYCWPLSKSSLN
jgi:methylaspartate mutase epsilon subunit